MNLFQSLLFLSCLALVVFSQTCYERVGKCVEKKMKRKLESKMSEMKREIKTECLGQCANLECMKEGAMDAVHDACPNLGEKPSEEDKMKMKIGMSMMMMKKMVTSMVENGGMPNFAEGMQKRDMMREKLEKVVNATCEQPDAVVSCIEGVIQPKMMAKMQKIREAVQKVDGQQQGGRQSGNGQRRGLFGGGPPPFLRGRGQGRGIFPLLGGGNSGQQLSREEVAQKVLAVFQELHKQEINQCKNQVKRNRRGCRNQLNNRRVTKEQLNAFMAKKQEKMEAMKAEVGQKLQAACTCMESLNNDDFDAISDAVEECDEDLPSGFDPQKVVQMVQGKLCNDDAEGMGMPF